MEYTDFFKDKRVTIMGLGLLGRGVGDADFLAPLVKELVVTDKKSEKELQQSVSRLSSHKNIVWHLGGHDMHDFTDTDMVIKAAGVPLDSSEIAAAREAGVPVYMSTALAAKFAVEAGARIVGVTGTRGKSTVAHMIHHVLQKAGRRSYLGGNIRGVSTLALLSDIQKGDLFVLELDSWQLQGFGDLKMSPHVAVVTNLMPDHQNYYPDMETYFRDKTHIFRYQKEGDALFVGSSVSGRVRDVGAPVAPNELIPIPHDWHLKIPGEHNRENAALAAGALRALNLSEEEIQSGLESFEAVEGRLQLVREVKGVQVYNDNNATTPEATSAALRALDSGKKNIILIMGGADKGLDLSELLEEVRVRCKDVLFLAGTGTQRIRSAMPDALEYQSVQEAVAEAFKKATEGDVILFSPAFASFGMFVNEYDRNDQFMKAVAAV